MMFDFQVQFGDNIKSGEFDPDTVTRCPADLIPLPGHELLDVKVVDDDNHTCIALQGDFTISVPIITLQGPQMAYVNIPTDAQASGDCPHRGNNQTLQLRFAQDWELTFTFSKSPVNVVSISEILLSYDTSLFQTQPPAKADNHTIRFPKTHFLNLRPGEYYMCDSNITLVDVTEQKSNVKISSTNFRYRAFVKDGGHVFTGRHFDCSADITPADSAIPIMVGGACAAIVSVVLTIYLCRRPHRRPYQQM